MACYLWQSTSPKFAPKEKSIAAPWNAQVVPKEHLAASEVQQL
jgi:hypothetical protein